MAVRTIYVVTDSEGAFEYERALRADIRGIEVQLGAGDTALIAPDVEATDGTYGTLFMSEGGLTEDRIYFPDAVCMGTLKVTVANAGADQRGRIYVLYR